MKIINKIASVIFVAMFSLANFVVPVFADTGLGVSPMSDKIILKPGDEYGGDITVINQSSDNENVNFKVEVIPFYVDENYKNIFDEEVGDYNQIVKWITLDNAQGTLTPGESIKIHYNIEVPMSAPAGGQYAAIRVLDVGNYDESGPNGEMSTTINTVYGVSYLILAEITGKTTRSGEISEANLSSFLLTGNITGSSIVKNTGNVHGTAKYTLQVFPIFSSEEIYTNEENPDERNIMPERTYYHETSWDQTPGIGIFNVIYTVEFEGITTEVSKLVIVCPIWLLFIIIFAIFALIFYFITRTKARKKASQKISRN